ncbi:hypothetical protein Cni_G03383 [Canna indica]|uniref:Uncharacterized protein n=1 Tax=Canna indica TaxID=4628 RepID=A0AAQ3JSD0_9LILI|nr:hypothetical protein Cni_G03383 [Canna indica]
MNRQLTRSISEAEVKFAVFSLDLGAVPGDDGFTARTWNEDLVRCSFTPEVAEVILHIVPTSHEDKFLWTLENHGSYSVASGPGLSPPPPAGRAPSRRPQTRPSRSSRAVSRVGAGPSSSAAITTASFFASRPTARSGANAGGRGRRWPRRRKEGRGSAAVALTVGAGVSKAVSGERAGECGGLRGSAGDASEGDEGAGGGVVISGARK